MEYDNLLNIINDLLNCSEITTSSYSCAMNKNDFKKKIYRIDMQTFNKLHLYSIIRSDSVDRETDEENYVLDLDDYSVSKLNKILVLILRINNPRYSFFDEFKNEYLETLNILKLKEERKIKLILLKH